MEQPRSAPHRGSEVAVRVVGAVLTAVAGVPFLLLAWMTLASRFGPAAHDPHGYGLIFGALLAIPCGFLTSLVAPLAFPRDRRLIAYRVSLLLFLVATAVLLGAWFTA